MREQGSNQFITFCFVCGLEGPRWGLISSQPTIDSFGNAAFVLVASRRAARNMENGVIYGFGPFIILKFEIVFILFCIIWFFLFL